MPTFEERLTLLENEHAQLKKNNTELKKTIELQTIAIGALVNKAAFERLNERYDKLFESLITHDQFTNAQLSELRTQQTELDGKIVGLQTELRSQYTELDGKIVGLQTELRSQYTELDGKVVGLQTEVRQRFEVQDKRLDRLETTMSEHTTLLTQILARLPEKP